VSDPRPLLDGIALALLADVRRIFAERGEPKRLASSTIAAALAKLEPRPWPEVSGGKPITTTKLAKLLGRFGIAPARDRRERYYRRDGFTEAWRRHLAPEGGGPVDGLGEPPDPRKRSHRDGLTGSPPGPELGDWQPGTDAAISAAEVGMAPKVFTAQLAAFRAHWLAQAGPAARQDWTLIWRDWCRDWRLRCSSPAPP
jgi:Protein of unknown function (DUF3631)